VADGYAVARVNRAGIVERIAYLGGYRPIAVCREGDHLSVCVANSTEALEVINKVIFDEKPRTMVVLVIGKTETGRRLARIYPGTRPDWVFVVIHKLGNDNKGEKAS